MAAPDINTQNKAKRRENNQRDGNESEASLVNRSLNWSRQDASRPRAPGGISKDGNSDREQDGLGDQADLPEKRSGAVKSEENDPGQTDHNTARKDFPSSAGGQERAKRFKLRWSSKKRSSPRLQNGKAIKHGAEPGGSREDMNRG
jgi:hypothetical protein